MNQNTFLDKEVFLKLKTTSMEYDVESEIVKYLQDIENQIANFHQRKPATVMFADKTDIQTNGAHYHPEQNIIYFVRNNCEPIEYLINIKHESEHANQEHSKLNNKEERLMNKISGWLYPSNSAKSLSIEYTCNYLELLSKTVELQELVKLYNSYNINNMQTGEMFYKVFKGQEEHIKSIKPKNINKVKRWMIKKCLNPFYKVNKDIGLSRIEIVRFLIRNSEKLYDKAYRNYELIKKQYDIIVGDLKQKYELNYNNTFMQFEQIEVDKIKRKESLYNKITQDINIIPMYKADYSKKYEEMQFTTFDDFICFLKTVTNKELVIETDFQLDIYRIFCEKQAKEEQTDISTTKSKDEPDRDEL